MNRRPDSRLNLIQEAPARVVTVDYTPDTIRMVVELPRFDRQAQAAPVERQTTRPALTGPARRAPWPRVILAALGALISPPSRF